MGISMQAAGEALRDLVKGLKGRKVAVLGHMRPDGDCIGSQTALCRMLLAEGVDALCVNRDRIPPNLVPYAEGVTFVKGADYDATDRVAAAARQHRREVHHLLHVRLPLRHTRTPA